MLPQRTSWEETIYTLPNFQVPFLLLLFFSSRRRHTSYWRDWSSDVCSSDLRFRCKETVRICSESDVRRNSASKAEYFLDQRSEERRVGKECRAWWMWLQGKKK